jgi:hypothetical protein
MTSRKIPVDIQSNNQLNFLLLTEIIRLIETEQGLDQLLTMGCDAELIDQLRHRSTRDLIDVASRMRGLSISFSPIELLQQLGGLDRQRRDDELCEYFVIHGASRQLLRNLFKRSDDEIRRLRESLIGQSSSGRTGMPKDLNVRDEIHKAWHSITRNPQEESIRNWLYELHRQFPEYTIDTLYSTVREFEDIPARYVSSTNHKTVESKHYS